jgi:hypothetical protein
MAKDCPDCGTISPSDARVCDCGYHYTTSSPQESDGDVGGDYRRVRGWLLFLCVALTIVGPLFAIAYLLKSFVHQSAHFERFPGLRVLMVADAAMIGMLTALSMHVGIGLWRVRPGAVRAAKRYLLLSLGYLAFVAVVPFVVGLPHEAYPATMQQTVADTLKAGIPVAIWYVYLSRSKRVKATYPQQR